MTFPLALAPNPGAAGSPFVRRINCRECGLIVESDLERDKEAGEIRFQESGTPRPRLQEAGNGGETFGIRRREPSLLRDGAVRHYGVIITQMALHARFAGRCGGAAPVLFSGIRAWPGGHCLRFARQDGIRQVNLDSSVIRPARSGRDSSWQRRKTGKGCSSSARVRPVRIQIQFLESGTSSHAPP